MSNASHAASASTQPARRRVSDVALVIAFTCAAAILHVLGHSGRPLWLDEACTYWTVQASAADIVRGVRTDGSPPLHFLLVQAFTRAFGSSEFVLRLPSMVAATALVPAIYTVARLLASSRVAVIAAALAALSPLVHYYSVEARSYALVQLETLAIMYVCRRAMLAPDEQRWWILLGAAHAIQLWTHNFGLFVLPVPAVVAIVTGGKDRWRRAFRAMGAAAAAFAFYLPWFLKATAIAAMGIGDWIAAFWIDTPPWAAIPRSLEVFGFGGLYPSYLTYLGEAPAVRLLAWPTSFGLLALAMLPWADEHPRRQGAIPSLAVFLFLPLALVWFHSWFRQPLYLVGRYDSIVLPVFLVLVAVGMEKVLRRRRWAGVIVAATVVGLAATSLSTAFRAPSGKDRDAIAVGHLAGRVRAGDVIVATGLRRAVVSYYLERSGSRASLVSFPTELEEHPGWMNRERLLGDPKQLIADAAMLSDRMVEAALRGHAVWLLSSGSNEVDDYLYRSLRNRLDADEAKSRRAVGLTLLKPPQDGSISQ